MKILSYIINGKDISEFYDIVSEILASCIIFYYEDFFINKIINYEYLYFSNIEKEKIFDVCTEILSDSEENYISRYSIVKENVYSYIENEKSMILDGFVLFRLYNYVKILNNLVETAVNRYLIEKEYFEFIDILKLYVNSSDVTKQLVHLIYNNNKAILIDEHLNPISTQDDKLTAKYLSDINFSENDYVLNALLNIIPERIIIHLPNLAIDEFINTIMLIFGTKVTVCNDCNICHLYKNINKKKPFTSISY